MEKQTCTSCQTEKPLNKENFQFRNDNNNFRKQCKECHNGKNKLRAKNRVINVVKPIIKLCTRCNTVKHNSLFWSNVKRVDGLQVYCIECTKNYFQREDRKEYEVERSKVRSKSDNYKKYQTTYRNNNKEKLNEQKKNSPWYKSEQRVLNQRLNHKNKMLTDPLYKLKRNLRKLNHRFVTNRLGKTMEVVGCDLNTLIHHLESGFKSGMTWENYGKNGWHIDHIIPLCSAKNDKELYNLNHYTNLQPLWEKENLSKGGRII